MGLTLTKCAEWTSVQGGLGGKLENTSLNTLIIEEIIKFVSEYVSKNLENSKMAFKQPLIWETSIKSHDLGSSELQENKHVWMSIDKSFQAMSLDATDKDHNVIQVMCLTMIRDVLKAAGSKAASEMRYILEGNRDPVANILGDRFSTVTGDDSSIYRYADEIMNMKIDQDSTDVDVKKMVFKMALEFHNFDVRLMRDVLSKIAESVRLNPKVVENEVDLLLKFSGTHKEKSALLSIETVSLFNFVHSNGCRAPPWRQLHGDIAYFVVKFHNKSQISVTASSNGWFINNGPEGEEVFNKKGAKTYPDLISLLKEENEHFASFIANSDLKEVYYHKIEELKLSGDADRMDGSGSESGKSIGAHKSNEKKKHGTKKQTKESNNDKLKVSKKWEILKVNNNVEQESAQLKYYENRKTDGRYSMQHSETIRDTNTNNDSHDDIESPVVDEDDQQRSHFHSEEVTKSKHNHESETLEEIDPAFAFWLKNNSMKIRRYSEIQETVRVRFKNELRADNRENGELSESSSESEEDEDTPDRRQETSDMSSEYWQIQKLVKYLKGGNQTSTIISLCALRDLPLHTENCQLAIRDVGGLEVLINLLETDEVRCKIGSLKILKEISHNPLIRRAIADLGGLNTMVNILKDPNRDLKCLSAETIANVAKFRRARRTVRQHGGIKKLVGLLDCPSLTGTPNNQTQASDIERDIEVARCVALALWSCSKSRKNKEAMKKAGIISLLSKLLKSNHENMLIPIVGTLQECASEKSYRIAIRTEGMIEDLVKNLKSTNTELQMHCAATIFKCAEEKEIRDLVRQYGGLDPLVGLLQQQENKELLAAVTGAIWKCAISQENVKRFQELQAIEKLVSLLNDQPEEVLVNVVGALGEMAKDPPNRGVVRKTGGLTPLVHLLTGTNQALLVNTTKAIGRCAEEPESMGIIDKQDGVRLLWSLLKNPNPEVQANAAWAICPCIENAKDAGEMVRSFVGGLELIVSLLKSEYIEVLASVCAAIGKIAMDEENLAVITDHGVVPLLARLTTTTDDILRCQLAEAVSRCCNWGTNRIDFGKAGAVAPLVRYLKSNDENVHRSTAKALNQLSKQPENCVTMHEVGVVKLLLGLVGSADEELQEAAACCIANIRRLALANEKSQQQQLKIAN